MRRLKILDPSFFVCAGLFRGNDQASGFRGRCHEFSNRRETLLEPAVVFPVREFLVGHPPELDRRVDAVHEGAGDLRQVQLGASVTIALNPPYKKDLPIMLNAFGTPQKDRYRNDDLANILKVSPATIQWRCDKGKYGRTAPTDGTLLSMTCGGSSPRNNKASITV